MRSRWMCLAAVTTLLGCVTPRATALNAGHEKRIVEFDPVVVTGDLELEKLNAEELFAGGEAAYAANEFARAARYFGRLADAFPDSPHRRAALYNAGLSLEKVQRWDEAAARFSDLADAAHGSGDALDAAFRLAEADYHRQRYADAVKTLTTIATRADLGLNRRLEAMVQQGICELESGKPDVAEATLRKALTTWGELHDKDEVDDYFPAQAEFFLGEIYRLHYEDVKLDPDRTADQLANDLEYKAELLLSAQGHYLRAIRIGNGYWATAAGAQIGGLYENLYQQMVNSPSPKELNSEEAGVYRQELKKKIRVLITKAISIYERTLEAAERIGSQNPFVEKTRESLKKMKELLVADGDTDEQPSARATNPQSTLERRALFAPHG